MRTGIIRRFRPLVEPIFDLMDIDDLTFDERAAVKETLREQKKSTNPKWRVGAAAIAENGTIVAIHNSKIGPAHHAEQCCVSEFYKRMPYGQKKLKTLVVAGAQFDDEVIRCDKPYPDDVRLEDIKPSVWLCGKCLEFLHDCTSGHSDDVEILLVCTNGQILKTSLRSLYTMPHDSMTVPYRADLGQCYPVPSTDENKENANTNGH